MDVQIGHISKYIVRTSSTKFLGLIIEDALMWKHHIDYIISKLKATCFAVKTVKSLLSREALKILHFSYIHSIMTYGIIFWGNSFIHLFFIPVILHKVTSPARYRTSHRYYKTTCIFHNVIQTL
jgi:hypothetical protein